MNKRIYIILVLFQICSINSAFAETSVTVGFSPHGQAIDLVLQAIEAANQTIEVAAYNFTSPKIAFALAEAERRGVKVRILLDKKSNAHGHPSTDTVLAVHIPVRLNGHYAIMHDKYMIIDRSIVETGSFNYTASAEKRNAENALIIKGDKDLAGEYLNNWEKLWSEGESFQ